MFEYMEDAETVSKELADIYAKASRHLNYEIEEIYNKFKTKRLPGATRLFLFLRAV